MSRPFELFSWYEPFLPALLDYACENTDNLLGNSIIILPHDRPRRYLIDLISNHANIAKPALLPRMLTMREVISLFCAQDANILQNASLLDQVYLLFQAVKQVSHENDYIAEHFARMDMAHFLPWGTRLAKLFEEYMLNLQAVESIQHVEGEVSPQAAALLSSLNNIHKNYLSLLQENMWTTEGLNAQIAANSINIPPLLSIEGINNKHIFVAGFLEPHKAEQKILHKLWQNGAHICLHSDPNIIKNSSNPSLKAHWSCLDHERLAKNWKADYKLYSPKTTKQTPASSAKMHFLSGHDAHSQLLAVKELLTKQDESINKASTAIILTAPGLLMPMLHHLPEQEFNISMGYPLNKSPLFALLDAVMRLHTTHIERGKNTYYYWRNILHCLRHPYIQMLKTLPEQEEPWQSSSNTQKPIRHILHYMENDLRQGSRYVDPQNLLATRGIQWNQAEKNLIEDILSALIQNFATISTPKNLAEALMHLCQLLLNYGGEIWKSSPLDSEALYRLIQRVIPSLKGSAIANEVMPISTLFSLVQHLMQAERVPFEADPITGLQILGLLETRLLHFERVIIVDATDDILPGFAAQDPLLPDALRHVLGLADANKRERNIAHILHRLLASAKDVHFFWQEGVGNSNLFDGKKSRSRFIDSAIWKEEQEQGHIIESGNAPLNIAPCVVTPIKREPQHIIITDDIRQRMHNMLTRGISPTRLDTYIQCPQRFAWQNIYKFEPLEEVNEEYNPKIVGDLLHKILQDLYKNFEGRRIHQGDIKPELIDEYVKIYFEKENLKELLPPDSLIMLQLAAPLRLKKFLENQPEVTQVMALERKLEAPIQTILKENFLLKGILDRLDRRNVQGKQQLIILDYKTGKLPKLKADIWDEEELWQEIKLWTPEINDGYELLNQIAQSFASIQLPCYMHLCQESYAESVFDAAWVNLAENGNECFLLNDEADENWREHVVKIQIPSLLSFVLSHMATATHFPPRESDNCKYCPYGSLCSR